MENNDNNKKTFTILIIIIVLLFSILIYSWLETFGIIGKANSQTTVSVLLEETANIIPERKNKKIVVSEKENSEKTISIAEKEKILEELKTSEDIKTQINEFENIDENISEEINIETDTEINRNIKIDTSRFYYNQIDNVAKLIYDGIYENKENLKTGNYKIEYGNMFSDILKKDDGTEIMKEAYSQAVRAFLFDNPSVFFLDVPKLCLITETQTSFFSKEYNVNIIPQDNGTYLSSQFPTEAIVNAGINDIRKIANKIKMDTEGYTQTDKIKYVHDYLVKNVEYDSTLGKHNIYNIYGALVNKIAVCEGYAKSFKYILDTLDIPSIIVLGNAVNSNGIEEKHSWNYVYIDGKWYGVDVTFDDPIVIGGPIINENIRYNYYLKGNNEFSKLHTVNSMEILEFLIEYPELEEENYD